MENSLAFLPEEIIREILSRSSAKTLMRFTCVSKTFCDLITRDRDFVYSHLSKSPRYVNTLAFSDYVGEHMYENPMTTLKNKSFSVPLYLGQNISRVVGSCNGIICFTSSWPEWREYIWNPSLHQIKALPRIKETHYSYFFGFGYDSKVKQHKFVRIHSRSSNVDIYSLEKDSWKSSLRPEGYLCCLDDGKKPLELDGSLHWITDNKCVLKFGLSDEKVSKFQLPDSDYFYVVKESLGAVKGRLSVLYLCLGKHTIWSMMNANNHGTECSWTKAFEFEIGLGSIFAYCDGLTAKGKLLIRDEKKCFLYDPDTNIWEQIESNNYDSLTSSYIHFIDYAESLISVYPPLVTSF